MGKEEQVGRSERFDFDHEIFVERWLVRKMNRNHSLFILASKDLILDNGYWFERLKTGNSRNFICFGILFKWKKFPGGQQRMLNIDIGHWTDFVRRRNG